MVLNKKRERIFADVGRLLMGMEEDPKAAVKKLERTFFVDVDSRLDELLCAVFLAIRTFVLRGCTEGPSKKDILKHLGKECWMTIHNFVWIHDTIDRCIKAASQNQDKKEETLL